VSLPRFLQRCSRRRAETSSETAARGLLWRVFLELSTAVSSLTLDAPLEQHIASVGSAADRVLRELAANPPSAAAAAVSLLILEALNQDLHPFVGRWRPRLPGSHESRAGADWPLRDLCRDDLIRFRTRLIARLWQIGEILGLPDLDRLLPAKGNGSPSFLAAEALAIAESSANDLPSPEALRAAWHVYVEAAASFPPASVLPGGGRLGGAIVRLQSLADFVRTNLKATPPGGPARDSDSIEGLLLRLLHEGLMPFLVEWSSRYARFERTSRTETKWRGAEACRQALAEAAGRCRPIVLALGRKINAPMLPDAPLQLPAPLPDRVPEVDRY
jgi:hypothetical protein